MLLSLFRIYLIIIIIIIIIFIIIIIIIVIIVIIIIIIILLLLLFLLLLSSLLLFLLLLLSLSALSAPFGRRGWKMFYATLRDLILYLHKDESGLRKNTVVYQNMANAIRVHHSLATKATEYKKKQYVFRLRTADGAEYLFQTG